MRICKHCKKEQPLENFKKVKRHSYICLSCKKNAYTIINNKYYANNRRKVMFAKYNMTEQDYIELYNKQEGRCKICNIFKPLNGIRLNRLFIDHCHSTNKIRGLLCTYCNTAIGFLRNDLKRIESAYKYIEESLNVS